MYSVTDLIQLKDTKFKYVNKVYKQSRFITPDKKFLLINDDCDYVSVYTADDQGELKFFPQVYELSRSQTPIYSILEAIKALNKLDVNIEHTIITTASQYKKIKVK